VIADSDKRWGRALGEQEQPHPHQISEMDVIVRSERLSGCILEHTVKRHCFSTGHGIIGAERHGPSRREREERGAIDLDAKRACAIRS
jgi:hypothetical protein